MQGTASLNAPSSSVVVPHFLIGGTAWLLALILLFMYPESFTQHYFNFKLLAITHLLVLSWITTVILGALYQLLPVILLVKLYSERLAKTSLILLQIGSIGLVICFWYGILTFPIVLFGIIICLAIVLFALNILLTSLQSTVQRIEKRFITTSVFWLFLTVSLGLLLAFNLAFPFLNTSHLELLKVHAHIGIIGWFIQLIMGVATVLIPMFMLSHNLGKKKLTVVYFFINSGLIVGITSHLIQFPYGVSIAFGLGIAGLILFLAFILNAYKVRVKRKLDIGLKKSMLAFALLVLTIPFSILNLFTNNTTEIVISTAYISTLIIGFISTLIMAQTYKTLPFIIWLKEYKKVIGKEKTPLPKDLYSSTIATWHYWLHLTGFIILTSGILLKIILLLQIGIGFLLIAALFYYKNLLKITFHKRISHGNS